MFHLPHHNGPPSLGEILVLLAGTVIAALVALARSLVDGRIRTWAARFGVILAGGLSGLIVGAICLAYGVHPMIAIAMSGLIGAAGEYLFVAAAKVGLAASDDPVGMAERILRARRGDPPNNPDS